MSTRWRRRQRTDGARPYPYSPFCDAYAQWRRTLAPTMRQLHIAGEKLFLGGSGKRPSIVDAATGEVTDVELFDAVLGASSCTYAERRAAHGGARHRDDRRGSACPAGHGAGGGTA